MIRFGWPLQGIGGSGATVFGISVYGYRGDAWWHRAIIMPIHRAAYRADRLLWAFRHRFISKHRYNVVKTGLEPGYYDADTLILHSCFALLCRYVEEEHGGAEKLQGFASAMQEEPDPNAPEGLQKAQGDRDSEAVTLYRWWKEKKPADEARVRELTRILYSKPLQTKPVEGTDLLEIIPTDHGDKIGLRDELWALKDTIDREEQEMLHRLIDIRGGLWT